MMHNTNVWFRNMINLVESSQRLGDFTVAQHNNQSVLDFTGTLPKPQLISQEPKVAMHVFALSIYPQDPTESIMVNVGFSPKGTPYDKSMDVTIESAMRLWIGSITGQSLSDLHIVKMSKMGGLYAMSMHSDALLEFLQANQ